MNDPLMAEAPGADVDPNDVANWTNDSNAALPGAESLIARAAVFDKLIVMPMRRPDKTAGGILLSQMTHNADQYMSHFGKLVAMGPLAYRHKKWQLMGVVDRADPNVIPQVGDWLAYTYHAIIDRLEYKGQRFIIIADNAPLMRLPPDASPWEFQVIR